MIDRSSIAHRAMPVPLRPIAGESLFSIICRYHHLASNSCVDRTLAQIYGDGRREAPIRYLPSGLGKIAQAFTGRALLDDPKHLATHYTGLPYLTFCKSRTAKDRLLGEIMAGGTRRSRATLGTDQPESEAPSFCARCAVEDINQHGTTLWHLDHQLPGVYACPVHGEALYNGTRQDGPTIRSRQSLILPPASNNTADLLPSAGLLIDHHLGCLVWMAQQIAFIQATTFDHDLEGYVPFIRRRLVEEGFTGPLGGLSFEKIEMALREKMGLAFYLYQINSESRNLSNRWPLKTYETDRSSRAPARLIMVTGLIYSTMKEAIAGYQAEQSGGGAIKPKSDLGSQIIELFDGGASIEQISTQLGLSKSRIQRKLMVSSRIDPSSALDGIDVNAVISQLRSGAGMSTIVKNLKVQPSAIADVAALIPGLQQELSERRFDKMRTANRAWYMDYRADHPEAIRSKISKANQRRHGWLVKNDGAWLAMHAPAKAKLGPNAGCKKIASRDWSSFDAECVDRIQAAAATIMKEPIPAHLSLYYILRVARLERCYEKSKHKLSLTITALDSLVETRMAFRLRRLEWAFRKVIECDELMSIKALSRKSGLSTKVIRTFTDEIRRYDKKYPAHWDPRAGIDRELGERQRC